MTYSKETKNLMSNSRLRNIFSKFSRFRFKGFSTESRRKAFTTIDDTEKFLCPWSHAHISERKRSYVFCIGDPSGSDTSNVVVVLFTLNAWT